MPKAIVVLASTSRDKLRELRPLLVPLSLELVAGPTLASLDVDETADSFIGNALLKARAWHVLTGLPALADDSGLEVEALGGAPGILSARVAPDDGSRIAWLLDRMREQRHRRARFVAALALVAGDRCWTATGYCRGTLAEAPRGEGGFGYDPLFVPEGQTRTFAEMKEEEKGGYSHRGIASRLLVGRLSDPFVIQYLLDCYRNVARGF
ncbi:non-canonical purine NTP pyrophosphatase [Aminithiophilus ramosus]|uniref:dITP/XTP pyrophosphatase n=1 Tax=Aminithiophilus ramosus TaxID=3029084 RepID=A0A9Q7EWI3_9BACT|nr:non-canonical purine NTP pyrophosphatase [Aminithiophilus ramosus]